VILVLFVFIALHMVNQGSSLSVTHHSLTQQTFSELLLCARERAESRADGVRHVGSTPLWGGKQSHLVTHQLLMPTCHRLISKSVAPRGVWWPWGTNVAHVIKSTPLFLSGEPWRNGDKFGRAQHTLLSRSVCSLSSWHLQVALVPCLPGWIKVLSVCFSKMLPGAVPSPALRDLGRSYLLAAVRFQHLVPSFPARDSQPCAWSLAQGGPRPFYLLSSNHRWCWLEHPQVASPRAGVPHGIMAQVKMELDTC
jgi:hypothetical protein